MTNVQSMSSGTQVVLNTLVAALAGLLFGFDTAVIAGATHGIASAFSLTPMTLGVTVSCALWGTVVGVLFASPVGIRFGPRTSLQLMAVLYFASALGCALAPSWTVLLAFRFIGGIGIGGSSVLSPMYIAEVSPGKWRGRLVACFQLAVVSGILLAYISNLSLAGLHIFLSEWRLDLGIAAFPALLFFVALTLITESPRWLHEQGRIEEAQAALRRLGANTSHGPLEYGSSLDSPTPEDKSLFQRKHLKVILIAIGVGMFNQLSGINAVLYYLNDIFVQAGFSTANANMQAVFIGIANLLFTLLAMLCIDSLGRRFLLIVGSLSMAVCLLSVAFIFSTGRAKNGLLWILIAYIGAFAFSQGTVVWVYLSEIFPEGVREKGQSLGTLALWLTNAAVAIMFPQIASISAQAPFLLFSAIMVVQFFVALFILPETKGLSLKAASRQAS